MKDERQDYNHSDAALRENDEMMLISQSLERGVHGTGELVHDEHGKPAGMHGAIQDITERKLAQTYREMAMEVLQVLNEPGDLPDTIQSIIAMLKTRTGFDAVGLRLQAGFDFTVPYLTMHGAIVVRQDTGDVHTLADLRGRRVGVMTGDGQTLAMLNEGLALAVARNVRDREERAITNGQ